MLLQLNMASSLPNNDSSSLQLMSSDGIEGIDDQSLMETSIIDCSSRNRETVQLGQ